MGSWWDGRRVLILGAGGLVGQAVTRELALTDAILTGTEHVNGRVDPALWNRIEIRPEDLQVPSCDLYEDQEIVVYGTGKVGGAQSIFENPSELIHYNLEMFSKNIYAAAKAGVQRLIFISSSYTYSDSDTPNKEEEYWSGDVPLVHYGLGWVKRYMETLCRHHHLTSGMKVGIVRPVAYYGPYDNFDLNSSHVVPALIRKAVEKQTPFDVWGDGSTARQFTFVQDIAKAILLVAEHYCVCDPVNIASPATHTVAELAQVILDVAGHDVPISFTGDRSNVINRRVSDVSKIKKLLGYECQTSLIEGIKATIDWYRARHEILS
jgi:GDP-L-fucose synthase